MRVCILGNSHVACIKVAWDELGKSHTDYCLTFCAAPGRRLDAMELSGDHLVPSNPQLRRDILTTSGGRDSIAIRDHDAFCIVGLGFRFPVLDLSFSSAVVEATAVALLPAAIV